MSPMNEPGTFPYWRLFPLDSSRGGGTRTHMALRPPDFKSGASADSATPPDRSGVYQSGCPVFGGAAALFGVGTAQATQGPFGNRVRDGAGEVEGGESVEALDVATPANACV